MGTIVEYADFDCKNDCEALHAAMKGFGTDEDAITELITKRSNDQRQLIKIKYGQMWGKKLEDDLKNELGGHYEDVVLALFKKPMEYDASELHHAMKGAGTNEHALVEILCSRSNHQLEHIKKEYKRLYGAELADDISGDTSGNFGRLMFSLVQAARCEDEEVDEDLAIGDAQALIEAGEAVWGTNESRFNVVFASRSIDQLACTFDHYEELSEKTVEDAIKGEMSGDVEEGMLAIVKCVRHKQRYFAEQLYKSMKGLGTDDRTLVRIMVSRSEVDLVDIMAHFEAMHEQTLDAFIESDCSGDYKRILLHLCAGNA